MRKKIKNSIKKFFLINASPHNIALGFSTGTFWGIMPGEGLLTTIFTAALFKANKTAAIFGVMLTNMWMTFVALPFAAFFGGKIFKISPATLTASFEKTHQIGFFGLFSKLVFFDIALPLLVGFFVFSILFSVFAYIIIYLIAKNKENLKLLYYKIFK